MMSLQEAVAVLKNYREDLIPNGYWIVNGKYILRTKFTGEFNAGYYIIDGNNIIGTNPMRTDLPIEKMKRMEV